MGTITLTDEQTATYDAGDERDAREMLAPIIAKARATMAETGEPVTIETADGITIEIVQ